MPDEPKKKSNDWYVPPDIAASAAPILICIIVISVASGVSWARSFGDLTLFRFALLLAGIGVVLLFFALLYEP